MLVHLICAARPNFMKIAPLYHELKNEEWADPIIVHTGQHYDLNMSDVFFRDLGLPEPHLHLNVGSGSHAFQTGNVMISYENILIEQKPDLIVVVGDVNSTLACTLVASKVVYQLSNSSDNGKNKFRPLVAHLEAGLRSFDRTMPEEINRIVTDTVADLLWTPSDDAVDNLVREGVAPEKIHNVGNIMIDSLELLRDKIESKTTYREFNLERGRYGLVTLHRPSNVDDPDILKCLCDNLVNISEQIPLVFPVHPRTKKNLENNNLFNILNDCKQLMLAQPLNYINFMNLVFNCRFVITDSGGIQEETTYLGIPCLTMRPNTERPVTVARGTNQLCSLEDLADKVKAITSGFVSIPPTIEYWDGQTAKRISKLLKHLYYSFC